LNAIYRFDHEVFRAIHLGWHSDLLDLVFLAFTTLGVGWVQFVLALVLGAPKDLERWALIGLSRLGLPVSNLLDRFAKSPKISESLAKHVLPILITIVVSGLPIAQGMKRLVVNRERPSGLPYAHPQEDIHGYSFPSGHTTTSFAIATMLFLTTRGTKQAWMGPVAFAVATLVGISRIYRGVHWPTDVIGGAGAGTMTSCLLWLALRRLDRSADNDVQQSSEA
jgi:undecaprenyl-diphosphatase